MPEIKNATMKKQVTRLVKMLPTGENWKAEYSATVIVRALLEESGSMELLNATDADSVACRKDLVALVLPLVTAANNFQNTYISATNDENGKPLMAKVKGTEKAVSAEFV